MKQNYGEMKQSVLGICPIDRVPTTLCAFRATNAGFFSAKYVL